MVVFVDLDEGDEEGSSHFSRDHAVNAARLQKLRLRDEPDLAPVASSESSKHGARETITRNGFASALSCYPVALSLAPHLDLNDLHALSLTSRAIHLALTQSRPSLISTSLRCAYDSAPLLADLIAQYHTRSAAGAPSQTSLLAALPYISVYANNPNFPAHLLQLSTGKIRHCARDLVAPCRNCGTTVCRNCAAKPPSDRCLKDRYRRLCRVCLEAPLEAHLKPAGSGGGAGGGGGVVGRESCNRCECTQTPPRSSASSARSVGTEASGSSSSCSEATAGPARLAAFTASAFVREPCSCPSRGVYLCGPCGQSLIAADTTYKRVWTWRSRYSTHIGGGLGTGLGEGDQGQKCGRGEGCLEAGKEGKGMCWVEIDVGQGLDGTALGAAMEDDSESSESSKPGYLRQEMEGIGGVVKKKVRKRVKVGATVWEYDDERESGKYLEREASGEQRSWCGWCSRVVLGREDREMMAHQ